MWGEYHSSRANLADASPMIDLAVHYHRIQGDDEHGRPLRFDTMPFLAEVYRDLPYLSDMVAKKCTQVGWTEALLVFMVLTAGRRGRRLGYVMPHDNLLSDFVQNRIQPMIDRVPHYQELARAGWRKKQADNLSLRHFGNGSWKFVGSRQTANFREWPADVVIIDEVDECTQANLPLAKDRLRNSDCPQMIRIGNPRLQKGGISRLYERSDGRVWFQTCTHCGMRQHVDWFRHVVEQQDDGAWIPRDRERWEALRDAPEDFSPTPATDLRSVRQRCGRPWVRVAQGSTWVAQRPGHFRRGYHVNQLAVLDRSLLGMFREWLEAQGDDDLLAAFYTGVLGLVYVPQGARVTQTDIDRAKREHLLDYAGGEPYTRETVVCGVDVGKVLHVCVATVESRELLATSEDAEDGERVVRRRVWAGTVPTFEDLVEVFERYNVDVAVIDSRPESHKAAEIRDLVNGRGDLPTVVYLCQYHATPRVGAQKYGMRIAEDANLVTVDRTAVLDATWADLRDGRVELPEDISNVLGFDDQLCAPTRALEVTKTGERYVWTKPRDDHFRHADAYERIAMDLLDAGAGYIELPW